jgi:hypothetical protein
LFEAAQCSTSHVPRSSPHATRHKSRPHDVLPYQLRCARTRGSRVYPSSYLRQVGLQHEATRSDGTLFAVITTTPHRSKVYPRDEVNANALAEIYAGGTRTQRAAICRRPLDWRC